ncbi:hypothetical protein JIG36_18860 [Actinoplanes sp. LDG1-06]|uniref:Flavin reductase n=1 Tax=Paractinoplanes ovalisporus TaxID=2810368 RepID=A0ABS2ACQ7_9ACTN|nr:hypothetical protein [Actinoplanes ovalisporus]MBM2617619.1 hypothetical protein [Actinoplanes ovalisporus]
MTDQQDAPPEPSTRHGRARPPEHLSNRPGWDCSICGAEWPCATARKTLLKEFSVFRSTLIYYMATQMYDAFGDLVSAGQLAPDNLFERFVAWARFAPKDPDGPPSDRFPA